MSSDASGQRERAAAALIPDSSGAQRTFARTTAAVYGQGEPISVAIVAGIHAARKEDADFRADYPNALLLLPN